MTNVTPEQIDAYLPQIQCGKCGYKGCMPYAEAICFDNEAINLCPPGGIKTLLAIANRLEKDPTPYLNQMAEQPAQKRVEIREEECIGCTKCIQVCPVDAILGSSKTMHTVIADECTGCELCVAACPVDCIDIMIIADDRTDSDHQANLARERFQDRNKRLQKVKATQKTNRLKNTAKEKQKYIEAALARVKAKKETPC